MHPDSWNLLRPLLVDSCLGLFSSCGLDAEPVDEGALAAGEARMVAFIGFAGPKLKGFLVLSAPPGLLRRAHPMSGRAAPIGEEDLRDWLGELANQLLGRLKIKLLGRGISFDLSPPAGLVCNELRSVHGEHLTVRAGESMVLVCLDAVAPPGLEVPGEPAQPEGQPSEGDLMLFE